MSRSNPKITMGASVGYPAIMRIEGTYDIEAEEVTETFAVNRDVELDAEGDVDYRKSWNVTHIPTGAAVLRGLPSAPAAKAGAHLLEALGYGLITTSKMDEAAEEFTANDLSAVKAWVAEQASRSRTSKGLVDKINKGTRAAERGIIPGEGPERPARKAKKTKAGKKAPKKAKKAAKRKAAKKKPKKPAARKIHKKPEGPVDLLELARRARGNPCAGSHPVKERLLGW